MRTVPMPTTWRRKNGLECPTQSACKHLAPQCSRDLGHVRNFTHGPLFNSDQRRKPREIRWAMDRSDDVSDYEGWRTDLLQGLGTEIGPADRLSSWLATLRRRLGHADAVFR